jgi:intracellular multiplication protein IcmP
MSDGGNSNDGLWMLFFIAAITVGFALLLWFAFKPQLLQGYLWVRQGEMAIASLWTDDDYAVQVTTSNGTGEISFGQVREILNTVTPEDLLSGQYELWTIVKTTSAVVLTPLKWFFTFLFALMIYYAWFKGPTSHHRKRFTLDDLINVQAKTFRVISPIANFNPSKMPPRAPGSPVPAELPLFAEALSPEEFVAFNKIPVPDGQLDKEGATKAFEKQLGDRWQGAGKLPPYMQVLLAACALKAARKRAEADDVLGRVANCWDEKDGLKLSRDSSLLPYARKILRNKDIATNTLKRCNRHAFVTTAMLGALDYARSEGGVLAPAQFLWLRGHDRQLWYPMNNLGRKAFHAEAMGAMAHYRAEKQVQRPIPKPMVNDAVMVLADYLGDKKRAQPIPQLDFSMIKNKKDPDKNKGVMKPAGT